MPPKKVGKFSVIMDAVRQFSSFLIAVGIILTLLWQLAIEPALSRDFVKRSELQQIHAQIREIGEQTDQQDRDLNKRIDSIDEKITTIYQLLMSWRTR